MRSIRIACGMARPDINLHVETSPPERDPWKRNEILSIIIEAMIILTRNVLIRILGHPKSDAHGSSQLQCPRAPPPSLGREPPHVPPRVPGVDPAPCVVPEDGGCPDTGPPLRPCPPDDVQPDRGVRADRPISRRERRPPPFPTAGKSSPCLRARRRRGGLSPLRSGRGPRFRGARRRSDRPPSEGSPGRPTGLVAADGRPPRPLPACRSRGGPNSRTCRPGGRTCVREPCGCEVRPGPVSDPAPDRGADRKRQDGASRRGGHPPSGAPLGCESRSTESPRDQIGRAHVLTPLTPTTPI